MAARLTRKASLIGGGLALSLVVAGLVAPTVAAASGGTTLNVTTTADVSPTTGACGNSAITTPPLPLSLREATCLANNIGGTVTINLPANTFNLTNGDLEIGLESGQNVSLVGVGQGSTIIDAGGLSRVLFFDPNAVGGITASISGLSVANGADSTLGGAGILAGSLTAPTADSLTISNTLVRGDQANVAAPGSTNIPGGGVQFIGGSLTITGSSFDQDNSFSSPGSGVLYEATGATVGESLTVSNSQFLGDQTTNTSGTTETNGGALDVAGIPTTQFTVTNTLFNGDTATATGVAGAVGAAIRSESGSLNVSGSSFFSDSASGGTSPAGGAIAVLTGTAAIHYSRFIQDTATSGGGLFVGPGAGAVNATENWFGCNGGPGATGCNTVAGTATLSPRLFFTATATPSTIFGPNATSTITGSFLTDSLGAAVAPSLLGAMNMAVAVFSPPSPSPATINGVTTTVFVQFSGAQASATYNSVSASGNGFAPVTVDTSTTINVPITVDRAPAVTTNPGNQTVTVGNTASFSAAASGFPAPTVQWQQSTDGGTTFTNIAGKTSSPLTFTVTAGQNQNQYRAVFTNVTDISRSATTTAATLTAVQAPTFTSAATATFVAGSAGSFTVTTSGLPTVTSITQSGALPSGLTYLDNGDGTATISGTPAAGTGGTYPLTLTAVNGITPNGSQALSVQVNQAPAITTNPSDQTVNPGTPVSFTAAASGVPTPTVQWQVSTNGGASFSNIGGATNPTLTFTTTAGQNGNEYRAVFTNLVSSATTTAATLNVGTAPAFTSNNSTTFVVGAAGSFAITTSGVPSATLSRTGAQFPAWLTLTDNGDGTGTLTGTPPVGSGGLYQFTLKAANGFSPSASQIFTLSVDESPTITSANHSTFTVGTLKTFSVTTVAGFPTATNLHETGTLPSGVTFTDNGDGTASLSGTAAAGMAGVYPITIVAAATGGLSAPTSQSFTLTVNGPPTITSANHATFTVGTLGTFTVTTTAGFPTASILTKSGLLPSGVTFTDNGNGTATLTGTPDVASGGSYPLTVTASNGVAPDAAQAFTLTVNEPPAISSANHATFVKGSNGSFTVTTSGGFPTPAALTKSGGLPIGVTFTDNGDGTATLAGTPISGAGLYPFTITASNGIAPNATQSFTLTVNGPPMISSADGATFRAGALGSFTVTTTGGFPINPTLTQTGALPSGLTFTDNGDGTATLTGTPDAGTGGTYPVTITASNGVTPDATQSFTLTVTEPPLIISANNTTFLRGSAGSFTVTTVGGFPTPPGISETGALPAGVTLTDNGDGTATLAGTPTGAAGVYPFTIVASNGVTPDATQSFTLDVNGVATITSADHTTFNVGVAGSFTVTTTAGFPTATALNESGALPTGVTFVDNDDGTATLGGTPPAGTGGVYPITINATNGILLGATQSFTLTVIEAPTITSADNTTFQVGTSGTFTVVTSAAQPNTTAISESGALPSGVTFTDNSDGTATLAGTPAAGTAADYPITITATNGVAPDGVQSFTLSVIKASQTITFSSMPPSPALVGGTYPLVATSDSSLLVTFSIDGATTNLACSLSGSTVSFDNAGSCVIDANQAGDGTFAAAPQVQQTIVVATVATSTSVVTSPSSSVFGQSVTATATVSATTGTPAGSVQFEVDGVPSGSSVVVSGGTATSAPLTGPLGASMAPGAREITAVFTPDDAVTFADSQGMVSLAVSKAATTTAVVVNASTLVATVTAVSPGAGTPTGTVEFSVGGTVVGSASLSAGVATLSHVTPAGMTRHVSAAYAGDTDFTGSSGSTSRNDPTITATVSSGHPKTHFGWYRSTVTVTFHCTIDGSPLTAPCPTAVKLTHNGGGQSVTRTITAVDGGADTVAVRGINIDETAPKVHVAGVVNAKIYFGATPKPRCVATDRLSGVASCTIKLHTSGTRTTYKATATDKAGNTASVSGSFRVEGITLAGAPFNHGSFVIRTGHHGKTYTLVVHATSRPTYYDAAPFPTTPFIRDRAMIAAGHNRWVLGITMMPVLHNHRLWNLGIKIGHKMHVIRIRIHPFS